MALNALTNILCHRRKTQQVITEDEISGSESLKFDFGTIRVATDNFSNNKMIGQGGFVTIYKGTLHDGQEIAVKRLSKISSQGVIEFRKEVLSLAKLQHRNLVRLIGFCFKGKERLIIYEFMPNSSLDRFIVDPNKRLLLDWATRYKIIGGIARGLLYLHEDSQLRIIHRDLKPSNILLDAEMNPKISDFGMVAFLPMDENEDSTCCIAGTYEYMAPEYAMNGQFSAKVDVYSFGVLILQTITGQTYTSFQNGEDPNTLHSAWRNWNEGTALNLIDPVLRVGSKSEMLRCIQIGLLCVQEDATNRPSIASVIFMLRSRSLSLPVPSRPPLFLDTSSDSDNGISSQFSINETSITEIVSR